MKKGFKVTIVIAILLFLSLGIYTFAAPDDEPELLDGGKTQDVNGKKEEKYDNNGKENTLEDTEAEAEEETNVEELNIPVRRNNVVNNNEVQRTEQDNVNEGQNEPKVENEVKKDITAPKINIENNLITKNPVKLDVEDESKVTLTLKRNGEKVEALVGDEITVDGVYELTLVDEALNETKVSFTIDSTAPEYNSLRVVGGNGVWEEKIYNQYITNGSKFTVYVDFDEKLGTNPVLAINGTEIGTMGYFGISNEKHLYYTTIKLSDAYAFADGLLDIRVSGYADSLENVGRELVMATDGTLGSQKNIVVDRTAPVISGLEKETSNTDVTLTITDANLKSVMANEESVDLENDEILFDKDGKYEVVVTDKAGNTTTKTFLLDKTKATINIPNDGYSKTGENLVITEENLDYVNVYLNFATTPVKYTTKEITLDKEGTYKIVIYDKAGNEVTYWSHVDNTEPVIEVSSEYTNENITLTVKDRYLKSVKVNDKTYTRNDFSADGHNENYVLNITLEEEGVYEITAVDKAGHEVTKTVEIDRTAPERVGLNVVGGSGIWENKVYYMYAKVGTRVDIYASFAEKLGTNPTVTLNGIEAGTMSVTSVKDGIYKYYLGVKLTNENVVGDGLLDIRLTNYADTLGNVGRELVMATDGTLGSQKNIIIDRITPSIIGLDTDLTNEDVVLTITDENLKEVTVNGEVKELNDNTLTITAEGNYEVVATDKSGNKTTKSFTIDKTFEGVHHSNLQGATEVRPNVFYSKENDTIYMAIKFNEAINDEKVAFKLVNGENEITLTDVTRKVEEDGVYYNKFYTITKDEFEDGEVTMLVTGIEDLAGNPYDDVTAPSNNRKLFVDMTAPETLEASLKSNGNKVEDIYYTKAGKTVTVYARFNEQMRTPKFELIFGEKTIELSPVETKEAENKYLYSATYEVTDKTPELNAEIKLSKLSDLAGNTIENITEPMDDNKVLVDVTTPDVKASYSTTAKYTNKDITVTLISKEKLQELTDWELSLDNLKLTRTYDKNYEGSVTVKDLAGNKKEVSYKVGDISKTIPKLAKDLEYTYDKEKEVVTVKLTATKALYTPDGWTMAGTARTFTKKYNKNTTEEVIMNDLYGNSNKVTINVTQFTKLIKFTVSGTEYTAEEGMTWGEWINSDYNTSVNEFKSFNNYLNWYWETSGASHDWATAVSKVSALESKGIEKVITDGALWLGSDRVCYSGVTMFNGQGKSVYFERYSEYGSQYCGDWFVKDNNYDNQTKDSFIVEGASYSPVYDD